MREFWGEKLDVLRQRHARNANRHGGIAILEAKITDCECAHEKCARRGLRKELCVGRF